LWLLEIIWWWELAGIDLWWWIHAYDRKNYWYNETEWVASWMSNRISRGNSLKRVVCMLFGVKCVCLATLCCEKENWKYTTHMRILILGHLQNTMCHEKKTNCYCIF
jgi:hypothetical protein